MPRQSKPGQPDPWRSAGSGITGYDGWDVALRSVAGGTARGPGVGTAGISTGSERGAESLDDRDSTTRNGGAAAGMVTVRRCIRAGIAKEAASTTVHAVIWARGLRTRRSVRPSHTATPSASDRSADSR